MDEERERRSQRLPGWSPRGMRFHAGRWLLLAAIAAVTCVVFPAPRVSQSATVMWTPGRGERRTCSMPLYSSAQRAFSL